MALCVSCGPGTPFSTVRRRAGADRAVPDPCGRVVVQKVRRPLPRPRTRLYGAYSYPIDFPIDLAKPSTRAPKSASFSSSPSILLQAWMTVE